MNIYYLIPFLFLAITATGQTITATDCLFEGRAEVKVEVINAPTEVPPNMVYYTIKDSILKSEGHTQHFYSRLINYATHHSKSYDKDGRFEYETKGKKKSTCTTTKLEGQVDTIWGYHCQAYALKIERPFKLGEQFNSQTTLWIAEDLHSCAYEKYQSLVELFSNPLNKIALRVEMAILHNGKPLAHSWVATVTKLQREEITEELWIAEENSTEYEEFKKEQRRVKELQWRLNQEIGTDFTIDE